VYTVGRGLAGVSRAAAFAVVAATYLLAGLVAWGVAAALGGHHPVTVALYADVAATLVVFACSTVVANASLYDPYWSVAPPVIAIGWAAVAGTGVVARQVLVVALILLWAVRLTGHWAGTWRGLGQEDWRYVDLRTGTAGRLPWWLVNLGGIQLMPTLVVFAGMLAVWPALAGSRGFGVLDVLAAAVTLAAVGVEALADAQLKRFAAGPANRGRIADVGLWRWVRHPNYLGEIAFWWGLWLFGLAAAPSWWWTVVGPLAMVALFVFASVPLMDRRSLARRPGYAAHMARVGALLPRLSRRGGPASGGGSG
jgi:steroid 5-alpha reductase family enzyme